MKYGLDFGTSNSVISYNDGNTVKVLPIALKNVQRKPAQLV